MISIASNARGAEGAIVSLEAEGNENNHVIR